MGTVSISFFRACVLEGTSHAVLPHGGVLHQLMANKEEHICTLYWNVLPKVLYTLKEEMKSSSINLIVE